MVENSSLRTITVSRERSINVGDDYHGTRVITSMMLCVNIMMTSQNPDFSNHCQNNKNDNTNDDGDDVDDDDRDDDNADDHDDDDHDDYYYHYYECVVLVFLMLLSWWPFVDGGDTL